MKYTVKGDLLEKLPKLQVGCLVFRNIDIIEHDDYTYQYMYTQTLELAKKYTQDNEFRDEIDSMTEAWSKIFQNQLNIKDIFPSHLALQKRVFHRDANHADIPNINSVINLLNAVSIARNVSLGAHDMDKINGEIIVGKNSAKLGWTEMNTGKKFDVEAEEFVYADKEKILTRNWIWHQCDEDKITAGNKNIFIPIDFYNDSITSEESVNKVREIAEEITSLFKKFMKYEKAQFEIVDKNNPSIDLDMMPDFSICHDVSFVGHNIKKDPQIINRILYKAVEDILPSREYLKTALLSGRRLKIYQGFDPTAATLHIGHIVMMRKLEDFRKLGHEVYMLIGDFTGRIGDPTDKKSARVKLTEKQVNDNLKLYVEQATRILDINNKENPVKVVYNNDWLGKLSFAQILDLASCFTVQQMIKRDMFQKRLQEDKPIFLHEFLYPLMQGYDSVFIDIDVELGGNDQLFNMLVGRELVSQINNKEKIVVAGKLLTTTDGKKMGKTEGNMIALCDEPNDIYGKIMSFADSQILQALELITNTDLDELEQIEHDLKNGANPMKYKKLLAYRLTTDIKGKDAAESAQKYFEDVYQKKSDDADIATVNTSTESIPVLELLTSVLHFAKSKSEARRLIEQGAVKLNNIKVDNPFETIILKDNEIVVRAGKRVAKIISK